MNHSTLQLKMCLTCDTYPAPQLEYWLKYTNFPCVDLTKYSPCFFGMLKFGNARSPESIIHSSTLLFNESMCVKSWYPSPLIREPQMALTLWALITKLWCSIKTSNKPRNWQEKEKNKPWLQYSQTFMHAECLTKRYTSAWPQTVYNCGLGNWRKRKRHS